MAKKKKKIWLATYQREVFCCLGRPNTCNNFTLLRAEQSPFHDARLRRATATINQTLADLQATPPPGRHLALADTSLGLLLVWAEGIDRPDDISPFVRAESSEREIREALGLVDGGGRPRRGGGG